MAVLTVAQAAKAFKTLEKSLDRAVRNGMNDGLAFAAELAATKFMVGSSGGSRDQSLDPANPPPGPLKIRSGKLRRGIKIAKAKKSKGQFIGGLTNKVEYAAIHEFGGTTSAHIIDARNADTLAFTGRDGNLVFRDFVIHPGSKIPARPFLTPALEESQKFMEKEIINEVFRIIDGAL